MRLELVVTDLGKNLKFYYNNPKYVSENDTHLEIIDTKTGTPVTLRKSEIIIRK